MNRYGKIERIVGKNNQVNHTKRLREESFELGYKDGLNGESRTKLNNILSCEYIDGYSYGERDRLVALSKASLVSETLSLIAKKQKDLE